MSLPSTRQFLLIGFLALALAACGAQGTPEKAVESYLQTLVEKDADRLVTLSCAEWETQATMEVDSFEAVSAELIDASCQTTGEEGDARLVSCTGIILATYNDEQQELDLSRQVYRVVSEGGEWR